MHVAFVTNDALRDIGGEQFSPTPSVRQQILIPAKALDACGINAHVISLPIWPQQQTLAILGKAERIVFGELLESDEDGPRRFSAAAAAYRALLSAGEAARRVVFCFSADHFDAECFAAFYREFASVSSVWLASSDALAERLRGLANCPVHVYAEAVELSPGSARVPRRGLRERIGVWMARRSGVGLDPWRLKLLWFGGRLQAPALVQAVPELEAFAAQVPLSLECVTSASDQIANLAQHHSAAAAPLRLSVHGWSLPYLAAALADCHCVLLPALSSAELTSNGPVLESLNAGRFVVAQQTASYGGVQDYTWTGESLRDGLEWLLRNSGKALHRVIAGQKYVATRHDSRAVADSWARALELALSAAPDVPASIRLGGARTAIDLFAAIASAEPDQLRHAAPAISEYGLQLVRGRHWPSAEWVAQRLRAISIGGLLGEHLETLLRLAGFALTSPAQWNTVLFEQVVLPWLLDSLSAERYNVALGLEMSIYLQFVCQTETDAHFRNCFRRWTAPMREAGRAHSRSLPALAPSGSRRVGFIVHNAALLGHTQVLANVLAAWPTTADGTPSPYVLILTGKRERTPFVAALERAAVPVLWIGERPGASAGPLATLEALRGAFREYRLDAAIWISAPVLMTFAFAMRIAPVQIWWTMKYHALELPEVDGYVSISGTCGTRVIQDRTWRIGGLAARDWADPDVTSEAASVRRNFRSFDILLATVGRTEKLTNAEFLGAVARILRANPRAAFLWTGRDRHPDIQKRFEDERVAERCFHVGWVNTKVYAQAIDLFLDSFPFGCGLTLVQAMAAGKPAVFYRSEENTELSPVGTIERLLLRQAGTAGDQDKAARIFGTREQRLFPLAADADQYVEFACALLRDPALRRRTGDANRAFVKEFLEDVSSVASCYARHFAEILTERNGSPGEAVTSHP